MSAFMGLVALAFAAIICAVIVFLERPRPDHFEAHMREFDQ